MAGVVNSLVVLPNDETLIAGDFVSYNGSTYPDATPVNRIALVDTNGALDSSFEPASGASGPIFSLASTRAISLSSVAASLPSMARHAATSPA